MAYDEELAERIRSVMKRRKGVTEKKMFGGIAWLIHGHMACGIVGKDLMLRLGEDGVDEALVRDHTRPMDFTGKVMKTMVFVAPGGFRGEKALKDWIDRAVRLARTLPSKTR